MLGVFSLYSRRIWLGFFLVVLGFGLELDAAEPLKDRYVLKDGGQAGEFEVARDEIARGKGHALRVEKVGGLANADAVQKHLRDQRAKGGEEVGVVLYEKGRPRTKYTRRWGTRQILVQLPLSVDHQKVIQSLGLSLKRKVDFAPGYFVLEASSSEEALALAEKLKGSAGVISVEPMLAREWEPLFTPNDPYFSSEWHLRNTGQNGGTAGVDANVSSVWDSYTGTGVTIGIVDQGIQYTHPDLSPSYNEGVDLDVVDHDGDPYPGTGNFEFHGTAVGSVAAGRGNNSLGVCGVAWNAQLTGIRFLGGPTTDLDMADAFNHRIDYIDIKNNSWGYGSRGDALAGPGPLAEAAFENSARNGRGGKGTIHVFAAGNSGGYGDNANYDAVANSIYTIAVGAINDRGVKTSYSEPGACLVVVAPSGDSAMGRQDVHCADVMGDDGYNDSTTAGMGDLTDMNYTQTFSGTSSACPVVSGVVALMLQANPNLGWRDVQEILIRTATKNSSTDADWVNNGAGLHFNHKYGAGLVNAQAAVNMALTWVNLGPQARVFLQENNLNAAIPDNTSVPVTRTFSFTHPNLRVEHVTVAMDITHPNRGDLEITLISPSGTQSRLFERHTDANDNMRFKFTSVFNWGETVAGNWQVKIWDRTSGNTGTVNSVRVDVYGSSTGPILVADGSTLTAESLAPANTAVDPMETVIVTLKIKNDGSQTASSVVGTLLAGAGVTPVSAPQNFGDIPAGSTASLPFTFTASGALGSRITAALQLQSGGVNLGVVNYEFMLGKQEPFFFSKSTGITIPSVGQATPYPSTINVAGVVGTVTKVTVSVMGFSHTYPQDVDLLLVGPTGKKVVLMSDAGWNAEGTIAQNSVSGIHLTFDDEASRPVPQYDRLTTGTYYPANYEDGGTDSYPLAPGGANGSRLSEFMGLNPNGDWKLYVMDDFSGDAGSIAGGWTLTITTARAVDNIFLAASSFTVNENAGTATISVVRTGGNGGAASVDYAVLDTSTAIAGQDFVVVTGRVNFGIGETLKTFTVPILNDDVYEGTEAAGVILSNVAGPVGLGTPNRVFLNIVDEDGDGDGLPSDWETENGFNPGSPADGSADPDGDRFTTGQEFRAGTNPLQSSSRPAISSITRSGDDMELRFMTVAGKTYRLEVTSNPSTPVWAVLEDNIVGTGTEVLSRDAGGFLQPRKFYRLKVLP